MTELETMLLESYEKLSNQYQRDTAQLQDQVSDLIQQMENLKSGQGLLGEQYEELARKLNEDSSSKGNYSFKKHGL